MTIEILNSRILSAPFAIIDEREAKTITTLLTAVASGFVLPGERKLALDHVLGRLRQDRDVHYAASNWNKGDIIGGIVTDIEFRQNEWSN